MGPNKFEKEIREQINSREIQPSEMAWDRLDAMLSVAEQKKTRRSFGWLSRNFGIAAGILVALAAGMYFFTQNATETTPNNPGIATHETVTDSVDATDINDNKIINPQSQPLVEVQPKSVPQPAIVSPKPNSNNRVSIIKPNQSIAQKSTPNQEKSSIQNQEVIARNNEKNEVKNPTIVAQNPINSENKQVVAQNDPQQPSTKVTVSANSLLSQVDGELDLTFREKVLQKVNKNYKEVKVALSTRNTKQ